MKNPFKLFILLALVGQVNSFSQDQEKLSLNKGTIENQFNYVINKSNSYQDNKVIKKAWIYSLKAHVLDSLTKEKNAIVESKKIIDQQKTEFVNLQNKLTNVNNNLTEVTNSKDTISVFGIKIKKSVFKTVISFIIGLLFFTLLYFIYIYKNSNKITQKSLKDYNELESEFNLARTRSLEREQMLNRRLQDELNKQKK